MIKKKLPIGVQDFRVLREENSLYVDKTELIHQLISEANYYFLSRPRRFGKSLLLSTLKEIFQGSKDLFAGLWIENNWDWTKQNPVVHISFAAAGFREMGLTKAIESLIDFQARFHKVSLKSEGIANRFKELLEILNEKHGKVVVLIDEYDKPIVDYIDPYDLTKTSERRDILKQFFSILKDASKYIRFLFITGVSKFSKVSIFSDLNHLVDLTLDPNFAALCGYTQDELEHYFKPFIESMPVETLEKMKIWYNGYSWNAKTFVYNPFSVLKFFGTKQYRNYWFETGTPTFLVRLLRKKFEYKLEETIVSDLILESFTLEKFDDLDINSLLLQTGYLTIKNITPHGKFVLNYPNKEVKNAFGQFLLSQYTNTPVTNPYGAEILEALDKQDVGRVVEIISSLIQAVPDQNYVKNEEKFFHAIVHLIFTMVGSDVRSEVHTPIGRIDSVVVTATHIFLFEFKINETAEMAIQCIKDKHYAESLRHLGKQIIGVGVTFSAKTKGVADWKEEEL